MSDHQTEFAHVVEGQQLAAGDLNRAHHGWLVEIPHSGYDPSLPLPGPERRTIHLGGVRRWTYEGEDRRGLLGLESGRPWRGTEWHVSGDAPVTLVRLIKKGTPKPRKNDYREADSA